MGYNWEKEKMKKENNEVQSRREFFKKAAKRALPILGAVILASTPIISKAVENEPMGCYNSCYRSCSGTCEGDCTSRCKDGCSGCGTSCQKGCETNCSGGCKTSCRGTSA